MNNYIDNDTFEFGSKDDTVDSTMDINQDKKNDSFTSNNIDNLNSSKILESNEMSLPQNLDENEFDFNVFDSGFESENSEQNNTNAVVTKSFTTPDSEEIIKETKEDLLFLDKNATQVDDNKSEQPDLDLKDKVPVTVEIKNDLQDLATDVESLNNKDNSFDKKTEELTDEINSSSKKIHMSEEDLTSLTTFEEDKVQTTDIKSLFDRVGVNVKEASEVFKRNTEMKEKLDSRFEELKKLQLEVARKKEEQYEEINSYKEEVLSKLTEKKEEIEKRLDKLRDYQSSLEKEKEEFEQYRKKEKEEIERVQREVQEAYDNRREELNHIEDVLRRQKDLLDEERNQLSLDKIQYESDKNELANNLLKFNEIVDSFTNGMDKLDKE